MGHPWTPTDEHRKTAPRQVAWEYVSLLAAAEQMAEGHPSPINHQIQESYLVHLRNLAEFFHKGVAAFRTKPGILPERDCDTIFAIDLCSSVTWDAKPFRQASRLRRAIDKTLSHLTYSRDLTAGYSEIEIPFDGPTHLHGTVTLIRRAWDNFLPAVLPEYRNSLANRVEEYAVKLKVSLSDFDERFDSRAKLLRDWHLNETPDGLL